MPSWSYILLAALLAALAVGLPLAVWVRRLQSSLQHMLEKTEERESDAPLPVLQDAVPVEPFHDPLTGLPSRTLLLDRLQHAILKAEREKRRLAVMSLAVGGSRPNGEPDDRLLQEVAERLRTCLRGTDTIARLGGGAFVILLEDLAAPEHAGSVAANLVAVIGLPVETGGQSLQMGAAVGIALYPEDGTDGAVLLKSADVALDTARREGQGGFRFFRPALTDQAARRMDLENELRNALAHGELELHFQPKVRLDTQLPDGVEALVRWRHPERGLLLPADFIPLAEETGIMAGIGDWVLEHACGQLAEWRRQGIGSTVSINLSARQLQRGDLPERVATLARQYDVPPTGLEVEVAEDVLMADPERYGKDLAKLREMGVRVAVDAFGTGRSGLAYLRRLPIDILKIGRPLAAGVGSEPSMQVVRAAVAIARILRFGLVAVGVETREQAEALRAAGCNLAQGFLFARPQAADVTEVWLTTRALSQS